MHQLFTGGLQDKEVRQEEQSEVTCMAARRHITTLVVMTNIGLVIIGRYY